MWNGYHNSDKEESHSPSPCRYCGKGDGDHPACEEKSDRDADERAAQLLAQGAQEVSAARLLPRDNAIRWINHPIEGWKRIEMERYLDQQGNLLVVVGGGTRIHRISPCNHKAL